MYTIIGVTGHVGHVVATHLQNLNLPFKAVVRNEARAAVLQQQGIVTAVAELSDAAALTAAFAGSEAVFVMTPPLFASEEPMAEHDAMLEALTIALKTTSPKKVVYLSSIGGQHENGTGAIKKLYDMERAFSKLTMPTAAIRAGWFMENFTGNVEGIRETGKLMSFIAPVSKVVPMIATADIGLLATNLLQEEWQGHRVLELAGAEPYSCEDVAKAFENLLKRPVEAEAISETAYEDAYLSFGFTPKASVLMAEMNVGFNTGHIAFEGNGCETVKGNTTLEGCLKHYC